MAITEKNSLTTFAIALSTVLMTPSANATLLNAPSSGSLTMNLDREALWPYAGGYFLSTLWQGAASDPQNPENSGDALISRLNNREIVALNQVFALTAIGADPINQAEQRFVKGTSAEFGIDSETLAGVAGTQIGMTGVQGFYAPNWPPNGAGLVNGDFSIAYDESRQNDGRTGWYLANNIYFTLAVYDFSNLILTVTDADNWQLSGSLLMSPENGRMLQGELLKNVGEFCLGAGAFTGCGQVSSVPIPAALWLFSSSLLGYAALTRRKQHPHLLSLGENA